MDFQWQVDNEAPPPTPAPPVTSPPIRRRRKAVLYLSIMAAGAVALALWWPKHRADQVLRAVEAEARTTLERELRAAREGDDEVFRAITGVHLDRAARDPITGMTPPLPSVQSLPGVDIIVRPVPPETRGAPVSSAEAELTYWITDGLGSGPYTERRTLSVDKKGAWHSEPVATPGLASPDAARFRPADWLASHAVIAPVSGPGTIRLLHSEADAAEARVWYDSLAREVEAYCRARDARSGSSVPPALAEPCALSVALSGSAGSVANVTHRGVTHLVLPSPAAFGPLEPDTSEVLRRTAATYVLGALARVPPFSQPWMKDDGSLSRTVSGAYGAREALRGALLEAWLAHRGLTPVSEKRQARPPGTEGLDELTLASWLSMPRFSRPRHTESARQVAAHIVAATGAEAVPALLAGAHTNPVEWLSQVIPTAVAEQVAAWPGLLQPFTGERIALGQCGATRAGFRRDTMATGRLVAFLPGRSVPAELSESACAGKAEVSAASWAPDGQHLAVACSSDEGHWAVVVDDTLRPVSTETGQEPIRSASGSVCCMSWSGDGTRLSWLECCPATPRLVAVGKTISARTPGEWTVDWAHAVQGVRESWQSDDTSWFGELTSSDLVSEALVYGSRPRLSFLTTAAIAWAPSGELAAAWGPATSAAVDPGARGYVVGEPEGGVRWRSPGLRPVWRQDGARIAEIETVSDAGFAVAVRAVDTGGAISRVTLDPLSLASGTHPPEPRADYLAPSDLSYSPDGRWIVIAGGWWWANRSPEWGGSFVAAWNPETGAITVRSGTGVELLVGWWPDGSARLVRPGQDGGTIVAAWDPATGASADRTIIATGAGQMPARAETILSNDPTAGGLVLADLAGRRLWTYRSRACIPGAWQPAGLDEP